MRLKQGRKILKVRILYVTLLLFMIITTMFESVFAFGVETQLEETIEDSMHREIDRLSDGPSVEKEPSIEGAHRAEEAYVIDIGSTTLENQIAPIPGVVFINNILYFDIGAKDTYIITGTTESRMIVVEEDATVSIILDTVNISSTQSPIQVRGITNILLRNRNTLVCTGSFEATSGIHVASTGTLIVEGEANSALDVRGGRNGAGIGGGDSTGTGNIEIRGGTIEATGGQFGAGIGTGGRIEALHNPGDTTGMIEINISGGNITALGGGVAAGIGTGSLGMADIKIDISGGNIEAVGGGVNNFDSGAGIGTGSLVNDRVSSLDITISGGHIEARGVGGGAGIGAGILNNRLASPAPELVSGIDTINIDITGGIIKAEGSYNGYGGSGIGTGAYGSLFVTVHAMNIAISGGSITATKRDNRAQDDIGIGTLVPANTNIQITGGSILPTNGHIYNPTNGDFGAPDEVCMVVLDNYYSNAPFSMMAYATRESYTYEGIAHEDGQVYAWLTYLGTIETNDITNHKETEAAQVSAPNQVLSAYLPGEVTLQGNYVLNTNPNTIATAYFEWGTTTNYGNQVSVMNQIATAEIGRNHFHAPIGGLDPGEYHYRFVVEIDTYKVIGENQSFVISNLEPSLDVIADSIEGTQEAKIEGIYDLNGHDFVSGHFELSIDGGEWFIPTASTEVYILDAIGIDKETGQINNTSQMPSITLSGLPYESTIHYRMTITSEGGSKTKEGSFISASIPPFLITIHFVDMGGKEIHPTTTDNVVIGDSYVVTAPIISSYTNVGVIIDDGERDITKSYYRNESVTQAHTITFVYDDTNTMLSLSVPVKMMFASFASDGGTVSAPEYKITNLSSLPVEVSLSNFNAIETEGLTLVQGPPQNNNELQLQLVGGSNLSTNIDLPNSGYLGRLAQRKEPTARGSFTLGGMYQGSFATPREPRFQAVFQFALILPEGSE